jgi:hypothetical protein
MLSVWLALIPVEVSAQGSGVEGAQTTVDDLIQTDAAWDPLLSVTVTIPNTGSVWHCVATGSADAVNPGSGVDNQYRFVLSLDSPSIAVGSACESVLLTSIKMLVLMTRIGLRLAAPAPLKVSVQVTTAFVGWRERLQQVTQT